LSNNLEAFAARVAMIDAAEKTLDVQTFIFEDDDTGLFLVDRMVMAADRGVRVRILLDDLLSHGVEKGLAAFDAHPNVEFRMFNPWTQRGGIERGFEFLVRPRLNHRMHNKVFIADGIAAILGGRNLADEYFDLNADYDFRDLDVLAVGPVVAGANELFDGFWNGPDAIPISGLKPRLDTDKMLHDGRERLAEHRVRMQDTAYADSVRKTEFVEQLQSRSVDWILASGQVLGDSPDVFDKKKQAEPAQKLADQLRATFFSAERELLVSSPYFVPRKDGTKRICELANSGTNVRVLTNSLAATDGGVVHTWYSKYRKQLLESGVQLFELRRIAAADVSEDKSDGETRAYGSANAALHAKTFVVDEERVFIGSLNLDPRSVVLNTEIGVLIESPELSAAVADRIRSLMAPEHSYEVLLSPEGKMYWVCRDANGDEIRFDHDPDTSGWERFKTWLMRLLPIEGQI
jgi:putative cardiolipin synthase